MRLKKKKSYESPSIELFCLTACNLLLTVSTEIPDGMEEGDPGTFQGTDYRESESRV